jgi:cellulose biosynthesis protein BcsQ
MSTSNPAGANFPQWPVLKAELSLEADSSATVTVTMPDNSTESATGADLDQARATLLTIARRYFSEQVKQPGRLEVIDPDREWLLGIPLDDADPVVLIEKPRESHLRSVSASTPEAPETEAEDSWADERIDTPVRRRPPPRAPDGPDLALPEHAKILDREAMYTQRQGRFRRFTARIENMLKDEVERREEQIDIELAKRYVVHDTNVIVISSSKGGVAKTTNTIQLGTCLAKYLPNQRVAAIDFNVGGGALGSAAADDRTAEHTMFELHADRNKITRHSLLQPYVSSLPSGLDLLTVPPQPELALKITPQHYQELFNELLVESYDILLLDCSPDIMNPVTRWALQRGTQLVISTEQGYLTGSVVQHALDYLLTQPAAGGGEKALAVINKVLTDQRAGSADETERALLAANPGMPVIRIPYDLDLRALIDSGHYNLDLVKRRSTRVPIKELSLEVCRRLS